MKKIWHKFLHLIGMNQGWPEAFWDGDKLMIGFKCTCGEMRHVSDTKKRFQGGKSE